MPRKTVAVSLLAVAGLGPLPAVGAGWDWYLDGPLALLVALVSGYVAGLWLPRVTAGVGVLVAVAGLVAANQLHDDSYHWLDDLVFFLVVVGAPAVAGAAVTLRARQVRDLERVRAEYDEQQRIDIAAARLEEQNRIEQEVHARLAERIAAIAVQAGGAQRLDSGSGSETGTEHALSAIETEARGVLDQLRAAIGSLGEGPSEGPGGESSEESGGESDLEPNGEPPSTAASRLGKVSLLDWLAPALVGLGLAIETSLIRDARGPLWANALAALAVAAPLLVRRRHPIVAVGLTSLAGVAMSTWLTPIPETVTGVALMVLIFYTVGAWCRGWTWLAGWAVAAAGMIAMAAVTSLSQSDAEESDSAWIILLWTVGAVVVGRITAGWQERLRRTEELVAVLEAGKGAELRLEVARERQAIASQLHDTVAHAMTVVCLQAAAQQRVGGEVDATLHTIASTAAASLAELRDGLDAIETSEHPLDRSRIAALGRRLGVDVTITSTTPAAAGPPATLAYRVVREALVNAARHAPGAAVEVRVGTDARTLTVEILDDGGTGGPLVTGTGTGLAGLAETVAATGGELRWGPRPEGGYLVDVALPVGTRDAAGRDTLEVAR